MTAYMEADNELARKDYLDVLDEERDLAAAKSSIVTTPIYVSARV